MHLLYALLQRLNFDGFNGYLSSPRHALAGKANLLSQDRDYSNSLLAFQHGSSRFVKCAYPASVYVTNSHTQSENSMAQLYPRFCPNSINFP